MSGGEQQNKENEVSGGSGRTSNGADSRAAD